MEEMIREIDLFFERWLFIEALAGFIFLAIMIFWSWLLYVYVNSKKYWLEDDVRIREAEKRHNLAKAEQIRLESLALKNKLESNGIDTKDREFTIE